MAKQSTDRNGPGADTCSSCVCFARTFIFPVQKHALRYLIIIKIMFYTVEFIKI